jgi:hypothetical protein
MAGGEPPVDYASTALILDRCRQFEHIACLDPGSMLPFEHFDRSERGSWVRIQHSDRAKSRIDRLESSDDGRTAPGNEH